MWVCGLFCGGGVNEMWIVILWMCFGPGQPHEPSSLSDPCTVLVNDSGEKFAKGHIEKLLSKINRRS